MRHYEVDQWTDFVRNLVEEHERTEMEQHRANCSQCRQTSEFLASLVTAARIEQKYDSATQELAESARRIFADRKAQGEPGCAADFQTLAANLTYASPRHLITK